MKLTSEELQLAKIQARKMVIKQRNENAQGKISLEQLIENSLIDLDQLKLIEKTKNPVKYVQKITPRQCSGFFNPHFNNGI